MKIWVNFFDKLEIGDYVVFYRFFYDYYGIIIDKNGYIFRVIEVKKEDDLKLMVLLFFGGKV